MNGQRQPIHSEVGQLIKVLRQGGDFSVQTKRIGGVKAYG